MAGNETSNCTMYVGMNKTKEEKYVKLLLMIMPQEFTALRDDETLYLLKLMPPLTGTRGFSIQVLDQIPAMVYPDIDKELAEKISASRADARILVKRKGVDGDPDNVHIIMTDRKDLLEGETVYEMNVQTGETPFTLNFTVVNSRRAPEYGGMSAGQILRRL